MRKLLFFVISLLILNTACNKPENLLFIIIGDNASQTELVLAHQLKEDIESCTGNEVRIGYDISSVKHKSPKILIGTPNSNPIVFDYVKKGVLDISDQFPGKRGGVVTRIENGNSGKLVVLSGSDIQGVQFAVYEYAKTVLGIDPLAYWTGAVPEKKSVSDLFNFTDMIIPPPEVDILCYFENDVDELANLKTPLLEYDWESYTEMINSLVRLKYNAIHLFDMLGRPEFFLREPYQKLRPDYDVRISYIDSLINYAHDMGMMVAIDFSLGYKIKPMDQSKADCWSQNKLEWIDTWKYYFEETPLAKVDIITFRPRNQVWDWPYRSSCGEDNVKVFNEVYAELDKVIKHYKPEAIKVVTCYTDGMEMFNKGFDPPSDWIIAWCDNGWADFDYWPVSTKNYRFGAYMHAGFWLNHTVHDPYPEKIDTIMKMMKERYGATKYYEINGQQFRPFLINIEAFAKLAENIDDFDGEMFYENWSKRYFGEASGFAVKAMRKLHEAQYDKGGYVQHLGEIKKIMSYLKKAEKNNDLYLELKQNFQTIKRRREILSEAQAIANDGFENVNQNKVFFHDYIVLPVKLYSELIDFQILLQETAILKNKYDCIGNQTYINQAIELIAHAKIAFHSLVDTRTTGDQNPKWAGWYHPAKRRPNGGFPTEETILQIEENLKSYMN